VSGGRFGELKTRLVFAPLMLLLVGAVFWCDMTEALGARRGALSAGLLALLALGGVHEYVAMLRKGSFAVSGPLLYGATLALCVSAFPFGWGQLDNELYPLVIGTLVLLFPLAILSLTRERMERGLELQGSTMLGFVLVAWPMFLAQGMCFRHLPSILFVVLVCKGGDIGAYLVGIVFGKHKLIPHISPGKTVEGAVGSIGFSVALAILLREPLLTMAAPDDTSPLHVVDLPLWGAVCVGVLLNATTQIGDLIESLLKRRCKVKDSSSLLPAHGGILDLLDSLLFSLSAWFLILIRLT